MKYGSIGNKKKNLTECEFDNDIINIAINKFG